MSTQAQTLCVAVARLTALLVVPGTANAEQIPTILVYSLLAAVLAPLVAVPFKSVVGRLCGVSVRPRQLWIWCAVEWLLWFPVGFVLVRVTGSAFSLLLVLGFSAWVHGRLKPTRENWMRYLSGPLLALVSPVTAVVVFLVVFQLPGQ